MLNSLSIQNLFNSQGSFMKKYFFLFLIIFNVSFLTATIGTSYWREKKELGPVVEVFPEEQKFPCDVKVVRDCGEHELGTAISKKVDRFGYFYCKVEFENGERYELVPMNNVIFLSSYSDHVVIIED